MLLTVVWALDAPITATGGSDVLVAWAPAPFFWFVLVVFLCLVFVICVGRYAFLTGEIGCFLAAISCTVHKMLSSPFACLLFSPSGGRPGTMCTPKGSDVRPGGFCLA